VGVDVVKELAAVSPAAQASAANTAQPASFTGTCGVCHGDDVIRQQRLTRPQWDREINKMTGWGAKVKDEDRAGLLDYLFGNYGPRPRNR
jgi:mono/diheme cytochrome c family protein